MEMRAKGRTWPEIGAAIGMTAYGASLWAKRHLADTLAGPARGFLEARKERDEERLRFVLDLRDQKLPWDQVAEKVGMSYSGFWRWARRHGLALGTLRGEIAPRRRRAAKMRAAGHTWEEIGAALNVSAGAASRLAPGAKRGGKDQPESSRAKPRPATS